VRAPAVRLRRVAIAIRGTHARSSNYLLLDSAHPLATHGLFLCPFSAQSFLKKRARVRGEQKRTNDPHVHCAPARVGNTPA
jgi:hypothetical protein